MRGFLSSKYQFYSIHTPGGVEEISKYPKNKDFSHFADSNWFRGTQSPCNPQAFWGIHQGGPP